MIRVTQTAGPNPLKKRVQVAGKSYSFPLMKAAPSLPPPPLASRARLFPAPTGCPGILNYRMAERCTSQPIAAGATPIVTWHARSQFVPAYALIPMFSKATFVAVKIITTVARNVDYSKEDVTLKWHECECEWMICSIRSRNEQAKQRLVQHFQFRIWLANTDSRQGKSLVLAE